MEILATPITDCKLINADRHFDDRGFFQELFVSGRYKKVSSNWLQTNWSVSNYGVLRGIHISPYPKLCTCVAGEIFDVVVDMRKQSPTYLKWFGTYLRGDYPQQLFIPADCGHAFLALEDMNSLIYQQGGVYTPLKEKSIRWDDPTLGISWPYAEYIISEKDQKAPLLHVD